MHRREFLFALGAVSLVVGGCQVSGNTPAAAARPPGNIRFNCYSLLYNLLDQQRQVDKLLLVKLETAELKRLIKAIAAASEAGTKRLEQIAKEDPAIRLDQTDLPPGEVATRDAISSTRKKELLKPFNASFEESLLLTQCEALSYAWHLAKVAATNEPQPQHAQDLAALSNEMKDLYHQTIVLLRSRFTPSRPKRAV